MVLEHQGLLPNLSAGPSALQLYAAAAAQLNPRSRVPPWAPLLHFGVPGVFGGSFLNRPRFQTNAGLPVANASNPQQHSHLSGLSGLTVAMANVSAQASSVAAAAAVVAHQRLMTESHGCSEDEDDNGEFCYLLSMQYMSFLISLSSSDFGKDEFVEIIAKFERFVSTKTKI